MLFTKKLHGGIKLLLQCSMSSDYGRSDVKLNC